MEEETTLFQSGNIAVTNSRFVVGAQTFAMRGITSVQAVKTSVSHIGPVLIGLMALWMSIYLFKGEMLWGIAGILILAADILIGIRRKTTFSVVLRTAGGEVTAYTSTEQKLITQIIRALNEAIISHG